MDKPLGNNAWVALVRATLIALDGYPWSKRLFERELVALRQQFGRSIASRTTLPIRRLPCQTGALLTEGTEGVMPSMARDKQSAVSEQHDAAQPEPAALVAKQPVPVSALTLPGLALGEFGIQPKLTVGNANDPAEAEADRVADGVVAALHGGTGAAASPAPAHRQTGSEAVAPEIGLAGGALSTQMQSAIASARGSGSALPGAIRRDMETALDADLSGVRVHSGPRVADVASLISARAFTMGSDMFFPQGLPDTASPAGTHLIAHELAHAVANAPAPRRSSSRANAAVSRSVIRRNPESEKALAELAKPIVKPGPEVEIQTELVKRIEDTIPVMEKDRTSAEAELSAWQRKFDPSKAKPEEILKRDAETNERFDAIKKKFPAMDQQEIYLGSLVLNGIPSKEDEKAMFETGLVSTDNALSTLSHGLRLVELSKTEPLIVRNTVATMISSGQIDYLRKAGFVGKGWQIIVEVHYIRNRPTSAASMHKDTKGQTLFVNLNYTNKEKMAGPEFIVNPPLQAEHEQAIEENLPGEFMKDLKHTRGALGKPKTIGTEDVPAHGVVSFVDEAIHHSTPLIGHRPVTGDKVRQFLENEVPFREHYKDALAAWNKMKPKPEEVTKTKKSGLASLFGSKSKEPTKTFADFFEAKLSPTDKAFWERLLSMTEVATAKVERPALMKAGLSEDHVDLLLSQYGPDTFTSASIPAAARKDGKGTARAPFDSDVEGRKMLFKREMSQRALAGKLPSGAVKSDEIQGGKFAAAETRRSFFRTWVRAVRVEPADEGKGIVQATTSAKVTSGTKPTGAEIKGQ
jgi:hypothetical protein